MVRTVSLASIEVRSAAATCLKSILATRSGIQFWEKHKDNNDPMLFYFNPFRSAKKKVGAQVSLHVSQ